MKKLFLTLYILLCGLCLTYCQHNGNRTPTGFIQPEVNPALYQNHDKEKINLQDTDIVKKIHALDCYFEDKVKLN